MADDPGTTSKDEAPAPLVETPAPECAHSDAAPAAPAAPSFIGHAKVIGALTLVSRLLGLAREIVAARFFGAGMIWSAFQYAFTIPNLFRKLLGEGALSAAFIPLYTRAIREGQIQGKDSANEFASASVSLLIAILIAITLLGELLLGGVLLLADMRDSTRLAVQLTIVMLPYVVFVCATAFLSGILQVHRRFAAPAAVPIVSNLLMIAALAAVASTHDLHHAAGQQSAAWWIAFSVLLSGTVQIIVLWPSLRAAGFRFHFVRHFWTAAVKQMLRLSVPVAVGASILQIGVVLDKQLALVMAWGDGKTHMQFLAWAIPLPMEPGALARLNWAQFLYQFPLGVFAIALATAIFPQLSGDALDTDRAGFRAILRRGIEASLFIGLPASAGMVVVALPAVRLLFQGGEFTAHDAELTALSTAIYSSAIWAFSIQQVLNRAFYALHDMRTPLVWAAINLLLNLVVEIPLLWTPLRESAMAVGTLVSFAIQSVAMLWILSRRLEGLGMRQSLAPVGKMLLATLIMYGACMAVRHSPLYPQALAVTPKILWAIQLTILMGTGALVYLGACTVMGLPVLDTLRRRKKNV